MKNEVEILLEYFNWVVNNYSFDDPSSENIVVFRGHTHICNTLSPAVCRSVDIDEDEILRKAKYHACEQLRSCCNDLEKLVLLQHYELKTRLLDFSFNPLVALYMACCNELEKNGEIICLKPTCVAENVCQLIAEYILNYGSKNIDWTIVKNLARKHKIQNMNNLVIYLSEPQFFYPAYNNPRIRVQKGFFLIAPLLSKQTQSYFSLDNKDSILQIKGNTLHGFNVYNFYPNVKKYTINATQKKDLLRALNLIGIDESSMFPEFEHLLHTINQKFPPMIGSCNY